MNIYFLIWLTVCCLASYTVGSYVRFYAWDNFKGPVYEVRNPGQGCQFLGNFKDRTFSIDTDICIVVYQHYDHTNKLCFGYSVVLSPIKYSNGRVLQSGFRMGISSFRICTNFERGVGVHVDVSGRKANGNSIAKYRDVEICTQIPADFLTVISLNTYGSCITIYLNQNCDGPSHSIGPEKTDILQNLASYGSAEFPQFSFTKAFAPCNFVPNLIRLTATIYLFELLPTISSQNIGQIELAQKTVFLNNGTAKLTKNYSKSNSIKETFQVKKSTTLKSIATVETEQSATVEISATIGSELSDGFLGMGSKITSSLTAATSNTLRKAYKNTKEETNSESTTYSTETTKSYSISEVIEVPPCTEYEIFSFVKVLKDVPIKYVVYSKVTGEKNNKRMTASEIRENLKDLTFVENIDGWTIKAKTDGTMKGTFGFESVLEGHGKQIEGCLSSETKEPQTNATESPKTSPSSHASTSNQVNSTTKLNSSTPASPSSEAGPLGEASSTSDAQRDIPEFITVVTILMILAPNLF